MQGDRTGESHNIQPSYQKTQVRKRKKERKEERKNKRKMHNIVPQHQYTSTETMEASFEFSSPDQLSRGRPRLIRDRSTNTPGKNSLKLHVEKMTEEQLEQALETIVDPNITTIIDNNGNPDNDGNNNMKTDRTNRKLK